MKRRLTTALYAALPLFCFYMAAMAYSQSTDVKVAVLSTRADQIDAHLRATDASVQQIVEKIDRVADEVSEMRGEEEAHRWQEWLSLGGASVVGGLFGYRRRKEKDEEE